MHHAPGASTVSSLSLFPHLGKCGNKSRRPAPFPSRSVVASASSPLAGTVVHRHCAVDSIIMGDSRPIGGCCRIDIHVSSTSAYVEKEGRYMPGVGKGGRCRNQTRVIVGGGSGIRRGAVGGGANSHIGRGASGSRRDSVGGTQSHARGGGSGQGAVFSAHRDLKGWGSGQRRGSGCSRRCGIVGRGGSRRREGICGTPNRIRGRGSDQGRNTAAPKGPAF